MYSVCLTLALATSPDAVAFHRGNGCQGATASAGCHGRSAGGCRSVEARGCDGGRAGCNGLFGGRFIHRERHRSVTRGYQSAPVVVPVNPAKPMPKAMNCLDGNCPVLTASLTPSADALEEVNAKRRQRGLRPFLRDDGLVAAALNCARVRAANRIRGHTANDFAYLPSGTVAVATGAGALEPSWGFVPSLLYG